MKKLKLGKVSWLILSAGVFIVVAASLGLTHSNQIKQQSELDDALIVAQTRLGKTQVSDLREQQVDLQKQLDASVEQLEAVKDELRYSLESAKVTDEFFAIAQSCNVIVQSVNETDIKTDKSEGVPLSMRTLNASVSGEVQDIINFVIKLNRDFTTGVVKSAQISITGSNSNNKPSASITLVVNAYEGD